MGMWGTKYINFNLEGFNAPGRVAGMFVCPGNGGTRGRYAGVAEALVAEHLSHTCFMRKEE